MYATLDSGVDYLTGPAKLSTRVVSTPEPCIQISIHQSPEPPVGKKPNFDKIMDLMLTPDEVKELAVTLENWLSTLNLPGPEEENQLLEYLVETGGPGQVLTESEAEGEHERWMNRGEDGPMAP